MIDSSVIPDTPGHHLEHASSPCGRKVLISAFAKAVRPRQRLTVSQWADEHRVLTTKDSPWPGRWRTWRNPCLREIMDCMSVHHPVREITVMKSSQFGVTNGPFLASIGYYMHHAPCAMMVLMPTLDERDKWRAQKFNPLLTDTEVIKDLIGGLRKRDSSNRKGMIDFPGGILYLAGGNSPNSYAQATIKVLMMDDLDRFPSVVGKEGDAVSLGRTRFKKHTRYKFLKASTPTIEGASMIDREYREGDMRRYYIQCPHCGEYQYLKWPNLQAPDMTAAYYYCEHNGCEIPESMKPALFAERGHGGTAYWKAEHPERSNIHRSYHLSELYAPIGLGQSWLDLIKEFKKIHKDHALLQVFVNSQLGELWKPKNAEVEESELMKRMSEDGFELGMVPPGFYAVTMSVDTQDHWLEYMRLAWGPDDTFAVVDHGFISGDTTMPGPWNELHAEMHKPIRNAYGKEILPAAVAIDSRGHRTEQVKDFVLRSDLKVRAFSIQGSTSRLPRAIAQTPSFPDKKKSGKKVRRGYELWNVGTEFCKDFIYGKLASDGNVAVQQRSIRFGAGLQEEYFIGLLAEVYDEDKRRYVQRLGARYKRNEPIDLFVYAYAIGNHRQVMIGRNRRGQKTAQYWERMRAMLEPEGAIVHHDAGTGEEVNKRLTSQQDSDSVKPAGRTSISLKDWKRGR